jgi:hypothetical protein
MLYTLNKFGFCCDDDDDDDDDDDSVKFLLHVSLLLFGNSSQSVNPFGVCFYISVTLLSH